MSDFLPEEMKKFLSFKIVKNKKLRTDAAKSRKTAFCQRHFLRF